MRPYFDRVEAFLGVAPVPQSVMGKNAQVVRRGVEAMGWSGGPLRRNAPGCQGTGLCVFGCPRDAKQAMHVSYIPRARRAGARVYVHCRAIACSPSAAVSPACGPSPPHRPRASPHAS